MKLGRHLHCRGGGILTRHGVVQIGRDAVTGERANGGSETVEHFAHDSVVVVERFHDLFRLRPAREGGETPEVAEEGRDLPTVCPK